jgi:hypothetical protein
MKLDVTTTSTFVKTMKLDVATKMNLVNSKGSYVAPKISFVNKFRPDTTTKILKQYCQYKKKWQQAAMRN